MTIFRFVNIAVQIEALSKVALSKDAVKIICWRYGLRFKGCGWLLEEIYFGGEWNVGNASVLHQKAHQELSYENMENKLYHQPSHSGSLQISPKVMPPIYFHGSYR